MRIRTIVGWGLIMSLLLVTPVLSEEIVLAKIDYIPCSTGDTFISDPTVDMYVFYDEDEQNSLFDGVSFDISDFNNIGREFVLREDDDDEENQTFERFTTFMTDGINQSWTRKIMLKNKPHIQNNTEANILGMMPTSLNGIDFAGYEITEIRITLNDIFPGDDDAYFFDSTFTIYGELDEGPGED